MATLTAPLSFKDWQKERDSKRLIELVSELEELALNLTNKFTKLGNPERPMLQLVDMPGTSFDVNLVNNFYNSVKEFYDELNITKKENANVRAFFRFENEFGRIPVILRELEFIVSEEYESFFYQIKKSWNDLLKDRRPFDKTWFRWAENSDHETNPTEWKGYSIGHELIDNDIIIFAKDTNGNKIARAAFIIKNDNIKTAPGNIVWVDKDHRRKGIATEMYKYAEKLTGKKAIRSFTTGEGGKFWDQPNRPFG